MDFPKSRKALAAETPSTLKVTARPVHGKRTLWTRFVDDHETVPKQVTWSFINQFGIPSEMDCLEARAGLYSLWESMSIDERESALREPVVKRENTFNGAIFNR